MPLSMHYSMFILTLRNLGTEKQKKMFLEPALNLDIHGCYAQTELSHGSDVQNLETTATYDK
jgi:acyl-CoA oxidase